MHEIVVFYSYIASRKKKSSLLHSTVLDYRLTPCFVLEGKQY